MKGEKAFHRAQSGGEDGWFDIPRYLSLPITAEYAPLLYLQSVPFFPPVAPKIRILCGMFF